MHRNQSVVPYGSLPLCGKQHLLQEISYEEHDKPSLQKTIDQKI